MGRPVELTTIPCTSYCNSERIIRASAILRPAREITSVLGLARLVTYPRRVGAGVLFALTLPGAVLLLLAVAVAEQFASRRGRRGVVSRTRRRALSAGGLDVFSSALIPGREVDLEAQRSRQVMADDVDQGAPPRDRIDRGRGIAYL